MNNADVVIFLHNFWCTYARVSLPVRAYIQGRIGWVVIYVYILPYSRFEPISSSRSDVEKFPLLHVISKHPALSNFLIFDLVGTKWVKTYFHFHSFKIFSLPLVYCIFTLKCLGVDFEKFTLLGAQIMTAKEYLKTKFTIPHLL